MAKVSGTAVQLGDSATATQNFVLQTMLDGTAKLSRGNLGSTTQDVLTVDAAGKVTLTNGEVATASKLQSGTAVASTSGTSIDFTGIPSWAKRITVMLSGVSTNGSSFIQTQVGNGSIIATGYLSGVQVGATYTTSTTGFIFTNSITSTDLSTGTMVISLIGGNNWVSTSSMNRQGNLIILGNGNITLSGTLDRLRITTVNGTDTFDAGSINIVWE